MGVGNLDFGRTTNDFPGNPVESRPFDFIFQCVNIVSWWRKVSFLPMACNSLNDPKVRSELGTRGGVGGEARCLGVLEQDYFEGERQYSGIGFNTPAFDLELPGAKELNRSDRERRLESKR